MVVLSVGLNPPADSKDLADKFGVELILTDSARPIRSIPWRPTAPGFSSAAPSKAPSISPSRL